MQTIGKTTKQKNGCKLRMEIFPLQLHLHYRFKPNVVFFLPWENRRHSTTPTLVSPRNITRRNSIPMTRHYRDLIDWKFASTSHIWVMTRHQYGISALVSQSHFTGKPVAMTQMSAFFSGYGLPRFCHSLKPIGCCLKNTDLRTKEMASSQY